jgi:hypothetical protein
MDDGTPGPLRHGLRRLLDGDSPWGSFDIQPDRFGVTRYRLVVYPPGITESERRRVRVARGWPLWGSLVWIVCEILLGHTIAPWAAFAGSTAAFIGSGIAAIWTAGPPRSRVRTMAAMVMSGYHDPVSRAVRDRSEDLAGTLMEADERLAAGQMSPAEHEMVWWRVYDQMDVGTSRMHRSGRGA